MEWITGIQNAINYIEDHITEPIDYEELGRVSFSSPFHFQRIFSILCGYTVGEYIRSWPQAGQRSSMWRQSTATKAPMPLQRRSRNSTECPRRRRAAMGPV